MEVKPLALPGIFEIIPRVFFDERGYFFESYNLQSLEKSGIADVFVQDNQSFSKKGVVRGLHFQNAPFAQAKLVRVNAGKVLDVVVDCRKSSATFGKHLSVVRDSEKNNMLFIPAGFAHGFSALEDSVLQYKCSNLYSRESEGGIHPFDPDLGIDWGFSQETAVTSVKDLELNNFRYNQFKF
jgi:dTDP-4-dehydrorhamnose 3,5-epimerase